MMDNPTDLFVSEDISKPENRINLALFHLQMVPAFHEWFMQSLRLPVTTVLYPVSNTEGNRPDFILRDERGQVVGYVEVECGSDEVQLARFKKVYEKKGVRVYSITGFPQSGTDLALSAIASTVIRLVERETNVQVRLSLHYLQELINLSINRQADNSRKPVSDQMLSDNAFVRELTTRLTNAGLVSETGKPVPGRCAWDTVKEQGFSLKVYSGVASSRQVALLSISGGRSMVILQSAVKYRKYLSGRPESSVEHWISFLSDDLQAPIRLLGETQRCEVSIERVMARMEKVVELVGRIV